MNLVFVITSLGAGGAEKCVATLARRRSEMGDAVTVLSFVAQPQGSYFTFPDTVRIEAFEPPGSRWSKGPLRTVRRLLWLRSRLKALAPDLVAAFLTKNIVLTLLAAIGLRTRVLASERNNPEMQRGMAVWRVAFNVLGSRAASIVMLTDRARSSLPNRLRARAVTIPNPCGAPHGFVARPGDGGRIVAVGRLDWQKGFDLLIEAFARLADQHPEATLTIFGEGPERAALERQARATGFGARIRLPGQTRRPFEWVEHADIFVLSSRHEGFANVLLEAISVGLPCVAFDCDFGPETILDAGRAGLLVGKQDVDGLAAAMRRTLDDAELRGALSRAATKQTARFENGAIMAAWDAAISGAMAMSDGSPGGKAPAQAALT